MKKDCKPEKENIKKRNYMREFSRTTEGKKWKAKQNKRRRMFLTATIHDFTKKQWANKLKRSKGICKLCGQGVGIDKLTMDHRFPISKAYKRFLRTGKKYVYTIKKIDAICAACNCKKRNK